MNKDFTKKIQLFLSVLAQSKYGSISVYYQGKCIFSFDGSLDGPKAKIIIRKKKCLDDFFLKGDLGWAESYIEENWDTPNLTNFLEWGAKNFHEFSKFIRGKWYIILQLRLKHFFNSNTKNGSQKNIKFHYDLGNNFYQSWLDKSMTYSSAIFEGERDDLYNAQINKYRNLAKLINLKDNDKVLEIGCGWGGFSEFLAKNYKANVTAITISENQYKSVKQRIYKKKLNELINVKLIDYRDISGKFDKIVSIEMFEAVGEKYWKDYFKILRHNLKNDGCIGLQTITIEDKFFRKYRKFPDFIQTYIFPGGMLPSIEEMNKVLGLNGLKVDSQFMFGDHYAKTLEFWRRSFEKSWENIKEMGFNSTFKRMWNYYLSYCQGGFQSGNINVGQFLIKKM
jgi:cyclopropane-fatty-acyl-phospholipid synthase